MTKDFFLGELWKEKIIRLPHYTEQMTLKELNPDAATVPKNYV